LSITAIAREANASNLAEKKNFKKSSRHDVLSVKNRHFCIGYLFLLAITHYLQIPCYDHASSPYKLVFLYYHHPLYAGRLLAGDYSPFLQKGGPIPFSVGGRKIHPIYYKFPSRGDGITACHERLGCGDKASRFVRGRADEGGTGSGTARAGP
jgi:hypothetical protein